MKRNLVEASRQWSERPADQRFWTLAELFEKTKVYAEQSSIKTLALAECSVEPFNGDDLALVGPEGGLAQFQHYSFGQLANLAQAPASYLRGLSAPVAAACLNEGLSNIPGEQTLMFHQNGGLHLRCVTSPKYERIWNYEIAELALAMEEGEGWRTPPARPCGLQNVEVRKATAQDVLRRASHGSLGVKEGDDISPAGLYASDHDCFIFQINEDVQIDAGDGEMLYRGVFWSNSEVGDARFRGTMFLFDSVCGNHIVWGAKVIQEVSIVHKGKAAQEFREAMAHATAHMLRPASEDEDRIRAAKSLVLGGTQQEIVKKVFAADLGLSQTQCVNAYTLAVRYEDEHGGDPHTAWGYAAGVTRLSQQGFADERVKMDRAAGKILAMAF